MAKQFKVRLVRSTIGCTKPQKETVRCLGLSRVGDQAVLKDNPANRGQILKVQHLLDVAVEK